MAKDKKIIDRVIKTTDRWLGPVGAALVLFTAVGALLLPKDSFQQAKERLVKNPHDFDAQITLIETFLANNQFKETEKVLLLIEGQTNPKLESLREKKLYSDPNDIKRLIAAWEKIIEEKPNYRDGYLQLAYLHYKIYQTDKAQEYLQKAIELDPNYEPARELENILKK